MLIRNAAVEEDRIVDVRIKGDRITEVGSGLSQRFGETGMDARGNALIPGLHDHHMHLLALAASFNSIDCGPPQINSHDELATVLRRACAGQPEEVRGIRYHEGAETLIDRHWLDRISSDIPIRIQHRTGRLWILNSAALRLIATDRFPDGAERDTGGNLSGHFFHADDWLRAHLPRRQPSLAATSQRLAACGVTGITDAGPDNDSAVAQLLAAAQQRGELKQRMLLMGGMGLEVDNSPLLCRGPLKLYLKESQLPDYEALCAQIHSAHAQSRPVAFHCVTRVELQFALAALADAGPLPGDRIEHASVTADDALPQLAALGVTVVGQPHFLAERGDAYLEQVEAEDLPLLYRARAFVDAGIPFAAGTDAPFGDYDPWRAMRAAVERRSRAGAVFAPREVLSAREALALFLGDCRDPGREMRRIAPGESADLCLLDVPWRTMLDDLDCRHVAAVWRGGEAIYQRP